MNTDDRSSTVPAQQNRDLQFTEVGQVHRRVIGRHFPAMTLVRVSALVDERAKVEIEATAVVPIKN